MNKLLKILTTCFLLISIFSSSSAQTDIEKLFIGKTDKPILLDGKMDESIWRKAPDVTTLLAGHPDRIEPTQVATSAKILYDEDYLYIGFVCNDSQPENILAQVTQYDADMRVDDSVYVLVDVAPNQSNLFFFATNSLGTLSEGSISKDGTIFEPQWNADWESAVQQNDTGWVVEIAIDLDSLTLSTVTGRSIGLALSRVVPRLDSSFWTEPLDPAFKLTDMGLLKQLEFLRLEKTIQVTPYVYLNSSKEEDRNYNGGIETKINFSRTNTAYLTVNPEFSTVEPDQERFNLTRFELWHPERREFLRMQYPQGRLPLDLFYSKRIGDIYGGLKIQGKSGAIEYSGLSIQSNEDEETGLDSANYSVMHLNGQIKNSTSIGFMAANKLINGKNFGSAGINSTISFSKSIKFLGQMAFSYGNYNTDNLAFTLKPYYATETFYFHLRYTHIDKYFGDNVNEVGYIPDDNRRELEFVLDKSFIMQKWGIERIRYYSNYDVYWGTEGTLRSWQMDHGVVLEKLNRFLLSFSHTREYKLYEKEFYNHASTFFIGLDTREWQLFNLILTMGYNFDEEFRVGEINKRLLVNRNFNLEYAFQSLSYPRLGSYKDGVSVKKLRQVHVIKTTYTFRENVYLKMFFQSNTELSKQNLQLIVFWRFKAPAGLLQVGILRGDPRFGIVGEQKTNVFVKLSYTF